MKRPLLYLAGGFVLGEVCGLRCMRAVELVLATAAVAAAVQRFCCLRMRRSMGSEGGPVLLVILLAVFALGAFRGAAERRIWEAEQDAVLAMDGSVQTITGRLSWLCSREEQWELTLSDVRVKDGAGGFRRVIVYLPKDAPGLALAAECAEGDSLKENVETGARREAGFFEASWPRPRLGQELSVCGKLQAFSPATNPGQFDFQDYYRAGQTACRMGGEEITAAGKRYGRFRDFIWCFRNHAEQVLARSAKPEDAALLQAILLGDKSALPEEIRSLYQQNGIAHLLAVSGLHLSMVSLAVYRLMRRMGLGFGTAGLLGGAALISYAVMTGFAPSVARALVMALCGYLAAFLGRTYDLPSAMALAGILVLWNSPYELTQAGVQLSFAAVAGIAFAAPGVRAVWQRAFGGFFEGTSFSRLWHGAVDAAAFGLALQAGSLPVVLYHFFQMPVYGVFLNLLVIPLMPAAVVSGVLCIACGTVSVAAGRLAVGGGHVILRLYEELCRFFGKLPFSTLVFGRPEIWQMGIYYGLFLGWLLWQESYRPQILRTGAQESQDRFDSGEEGRDRRAAPDGEAPAWRKLVWRQPAQGLPGSKGFWAAAALLPVSLCLLLLPLPLRGMQAVFLDVGQGDGICIRAGRTVILVDGGSTSNEDVGKEILEPYLKCSGISVVDYAIVSHGDEDHVNGLRYLLTEGQGIRVKNLLLPAAGQEDPVYGALEAAAAAHGARVYWFSSGSGLLAGKLSVSCLYPEAAAARENGEDRNAHSLVLSVRYREFSILLTGDMGAEEEKKLLAGAKREPELAALLADTDLLKVAHHGSRYSSCAEFLQAVSPRFAVISCAKKNRYGHPAPETVERLTEEGVSVLYTMESGAVTLSSHGRRSVIRTFRREDP